MQDFGELLLQVAFYIMRSFLFQQIAFSITIVSGEFYSSVSSSSSFSSSYTTHNGEEHSESAAQQSYSEKNSDGLNRSGSGKLLAKDGVQIYEETRNCDGGKCIGEVDNSKRKLARDRLKHRSLHVNG